jgi:uncharacterized membrane protein HdeD (DUF308 family)
MQGPRAPDRVGVAQCGRLLPVAYRALDGGPEMWSAPPWKIATIGAVAVTAGLALLIIDWTLPQLAAFVAMLFIARGALHIVTTSLEGMPGALSVLLGLSELAVGYVLLGWPSPTLLVVVVVVAVWAMSRGVTLVTNILVTRREHRRWRFLLVPAVLEVVLGATLFARVSSDARDVAVIIGAIMIVEGVNEFVIAVEAQHRDSYEPAELVAS